MAHILVVDDDAQVRRFLRVVLEKEGHLVSEAADGEVASRIFRQDQPNLVVLDLFMPRQEGLETIRDLLTFAPCTKILAISGGSVAEHFDFLHIAERLGAQQSLAKPFSPKKLVDTVQAMLR